ncbi:DNA topoisomerase 3 [Allochromatium humboldtianum]|uniref:DNA topoisomerase n=1 Tax=Allochromatium humboldtianum TaxID=504901 RepID=A0A850RLH7_9GAMM|nr:DNA topoisomerase 3 [Allochromatium humboldtianum]NVZ11730.1 DNA topoisomerase 3 [Allochromatium humboldtianum]
MRLFIAEKPSMGKAIAACLPGRRDVSKTHIEVGDDVVTWCVGHILEAAPPEDYNPEWKAWRLDLLPIFPDKIQMRPVENAQGQLTAIKRLLARADSVVHAGDPGREGQMIVDEVLEYLNNRKPVQRLLLNATDPATIKKQLQRLESNAKLRPLYEAAKARSEADWVMGMNLTRAATKSIADRDTMVSIGRVQTPTLALVVNRCKTIEQFVPRAFYDIEAKVKTRAGSVVLMRHSPSSEESRLWEREKAETLAEQAKGQIGQLQVETARKKVAPPKLHALPSLQAEANKRFKWSAAEVLAIAQELYVAGCLSYPRTECCFLPEEQKGEVPSVMAAIRQGPESSLAEMAEAITEPMPRATVFSNKKMEGEEHHAIIPTGKPLPLDATTKQRQLYALAAQRYLWSLCPDYEHDETQVLLPLGELQFKTKGSVPRVLGWKAHLNEKPSEVELPPLQNGEDAKVVNTRLVEGQTTPPAYYTEGSLIGDMGAIAKYVQDERIKAVLKETSGIGTAATQAETIEKLKKRNYIRVDTKGNLHDTPVGRSIIENLPVPLTRPDMTAKWEMELKQIAEGQLPAATFMEGIRKFVGGGTRWFSERAGQTLVRGGNTAAPTQAPKTGSKARSGARKGASGSKSRSKRSSAA